MSNGIKIKYFAALREKAGLSSEEVETAAKSPRELTKSSFRGLNLVLAKIKFVWPLMMSTNA